MMSSKAGILPWPRGFRELIDGGAGRSVQISRSDRRRSGPIGPAPAATGRRRRSSCRCPLPGVDFAQGRPEKLRSDFYVVSVPSVQRGTVCHPAARPCASWSALLVVDRGLASTLRSVTPGHGASGGGAFGAGSPIWPAQRLGRGPGTARSRPSGVQPAEQRPTVQRGRSVSAMVGAPGSVAENRM